MASKRLSALKSNQLDPSEKDLDEEHAINLSGVLSLTTGNEELQKFGNNNCVTDDIDNDGNGDDISIHTSESEKSDDFDERKFSGRRLTNSISGGHSIVQIRDRTVNVKFYIFGTRLAGGRKKHVLYQVVVTRTMSTVSMIDSDKATIERRYSDFHKLYRNLKKLFPEFMSTIEFPEKKLYGNLNNDLINIRSRLLAEFLQKVYGSLEIRNSDTFKNFFYLESLKRGCQYICGGQFELALDILLNGLHLQQKLDLDLNKQVIATLCNIVDCYMALENHKEVENYSKAALELINDKISSIYLVPLLQTFKEALVFLQRTDGEIDKIDQRLSHIIRVNQIEVAHIASLRELAVTRFK